MKLRRSTMLVAIVCLPQLAVAGGLLLPGAGAISTSRAGAAVASTDDGEAVVLNPAGIAKAQGTTITVSAAMIQYAMEFQRRGTYDAVDGESYPFAGQPFNAVKNDVSPPLGIGSLQPIPVVAVVSDLGNAVPGLHLGFGLYAPNSYPFRDLCTEVASGCQKYTFKTDPNADFSTPPSSARYDIMKQEAAIILPSLVVAYRVLPTLDIGLRLSAGQASLKSTTSLWSTLGPNYEEDPKKDGTITVDAKDSFVPAYGLGVTFRPTPNIELGANFASELDVHAKGTAISQLGPGAGAGVPGVEVSIVPVNDTAARCDTGGTAQELKACVDLATPMNVQIGGRYIFLDAAGKPKGDVELDLDWEHWGKSCDEADLLDGNCTSPSDYRVVVDATTSVMLPTGPIAGPPLHDSLVKHGLRDTFGVRLGGSYHIPVGAKRDDGESNQLIVRGGLGYDTAAAKTGWQRADFDGAARTTIAVGASYRMRRVEVSLGGGAILESPSNPNVGGGASPCNPTMMMSSCGAGEEHQGPDPINPTSDPQAESPVNQGDYKSHYLLFMLGASTWF